jgi:hypothetical protein
MGILDDAIREHLDLKRRRGADPADVERDERDALGPVRRAPEGAGDEAEPSPGLVTAQESAYDQADQRTWDGEPSSERVVFEAELAAVGGEPAAPPVSDDALESEEPHEESVFEGRDPAFELVDPAPRHSDPVTEHLDPASEHPDAARDELDAASPEPRGSPEKPPTAPSRAAGDPLGGETIEYDVERALGNAEGDAADEDVLEETPEFLQDTPDHDRLWFEQRPPRDFDFDG